MNVNRHRFRFGFRPELLLICLVTGCLVMVPTLARAQTDLTCDDLAPADAPPEYFVGLGNAYLDQGDFTRSIVAHSCAVDGFPDYAPAYVSRGYAYAVQGDDRAAMDDYNRALELDEGLIAGYNNRGMLYMMQGNFGLALTDFTLAVTLDPAYAPGVHNRGLVHAAESNYDLAIADFEAAIALDPGYAAPYASLGAVYSALALENYAQYSSLYADQYGGPARLPGGEPDSIINALAAIEESGNFSIWLAFLTPAR